MPETYTIGSLAQHTGVHLETIRYYQRRGWWTSRSARWAASGATRRTTPGGCASSAMRRISAFPSMKSAIC